MSYYDDRLVSPSQAHKTNMSNNNRSARDLFASLKSKASQSSFLRSSTSSTNSWFTKQDEPEPSLPLPDITHPFPVLEQPSRVLLKSLNTKRFDGQYLLSSNRKGEVCPTTSRGEREQFLLIPADADEIEEPSENDSEELSGAATAATKTRKDVFYLKSYKFNRYLSSIYSGSITTVDFSDTQTWHHQTLGQSEKWTLTPSPHGGHYITSAQNGMNLACFQGDAIQIGLRGNNDVCESWEVEFVSGELCFVSCNEKRLRCDLVGSLTLTEDKRGWEVWRFVEVGGGRVRIVSWMHPFCIVCDHEGNITTCAIGKAKVGWDEWTVEKAPRGYDGVVIKSFACARRMLCYEPDGLVTTQTLEGENAVWQLDAAHSQIYTLTSLHHGRSVGPFPWVSDNVKQSDQIIFQRVDDQGTVRLYHKARGEYLQSSTDGEVLCSDLLPDMSGLEVLWKMEQRPDGGYSLTSKSDNRLLAFSTDEETPQLCTVSNPTEDKREVWNVNPILPRAVSSDKIKTFAIGTSVAVGTRVAMPFLMVGMVAALPAEATLAASILSVGLTSAEFIASVGAIGVTAAIVFREDSDTLGMDKEDGEEDETKAFTKRPFCAWRSW